MSCLQTQLENIAIAIPRLHAIWPIELYKSSRKSRIRCDEQSVNQEWLSLRFKCIFGSGWYSSRVAGSVDKTWKIYTANVEITAASCVRCRGGRSRATCTIVQVKRIEIPQRRRVNKACPAGADVVAIFGTIPALTFQLQE